MNGNSKSITRRGLIGGAVSFAAPLAHSAGSREFRGYFPILQTPFQADGRIDLDDVEREVNFCIRAGADGLVWPQLLSEFHELNSQERLETAALILKTSKGRAPVIVGVQSPETSMAVKMAGHAAEHGAAAVIALPPYEGKPTLDEVRAYYLAIAKECKLPVVVQNSGGKWGPALPVSFVVELANTGPQFGHVKEEVPQILPRFHQYSTSGAMKSVFSGTGGKYAPFELAHGTTGAMGPSSLPDVVARIYRLYREGKREEARDIYTLLVSVMVMESLYGGVGLAKEILVRRGVFKSARQRKPERGGEKILDAGDRELRLWLKRLERYFQA